MKLLQKIRKRKVDRRIENKTFVLLTEQDIEKIVNGGTVTFEVEQYVPEILICSEDHYEEQLRELTSGKDLDIL